MAKLANAIVLIMMTLGCRADWWENMQLYQIYPRSFMDSNGDGIGDLKGIIQRFEHLADIGVSATWLSPIFVSPMKDFGYDIADFYNIAEEYGTLDDLKELLAEAKRQGIRVLLDFVPNHTSDQCDWFIKSAKKISGFENFYVWHPGRENPDGGRRLPPSNWVSVFRNSAWTWHPVREEYYLHQFLPEQPDLNYRDPNVVAEMKNVLKYWLSVGVDGFRVDAIPHLIEVDMGEDGNYPDEPLSGDTVDKNDYKYLNHIHTREREETFSMVYQWRKILDDFTAENQTPSKVFLMEAMSDMDIVMKYYGNETHEGAHFPFNFELSFLNSKAKCSKLFKRTKAWLSKVPKGRVSNWVAGNHDQPRLASRFGIDRADGVMMMTMLLPGVSVTYQGEEIAMLNQHLSYEDTQDPQACKDGPDMYTISSRDPQRTPFQWDSTKNAGFSTADKTWLPVADNYLKLNLENQKSAPRSAYKLYKILSVLRQLPVFKNGKVKVNCSDNGVLFIIRYIEDDIYVIVIHAEDGNRVVNLQFDFIDMSHTMEVVATSIKSLRNPGDIVDKTSFSLTPYEAVVLKTYKGKPVNKV